MLPYFLNSDKTGLSFAKKVKDFFNGLGPALSKAYFLNSDKTGLSFAKKNTFFRPTF